MDDFLETLARLNFLFENDEIEAIAISTVEADGTLGQYNYVNGHFAKLIGSIEANKHDILQDAYLDE